MIKRRVCAYIQSLNRRPDWKQDFNNESGVLCQRLFGTDRAFKFKVVYIYFKVLVYY